MCGTRRESVRAFAGRVERTSVNVLLHKLPYSNRASGGTTVIFLVSAPRWRATRYFSITVDNVDTCVLLYYFNEQVKPFLAETSRTCWEVGQPCVFADLLQTPRETWAGSRGPAKVLPRLQDAERYDVIHHTASRKNPPPSPSREKMKETGSERGRQR